MTKHSMEQQMRHYHMGCIVVGLVLVEELGQGLVLKLFVGQGLEF